MKLAKSFLIPLMGIALIFSACTQTPMNISIKTELDSVSYALGVNIAASLKQGQLDNVDPVFVAKGLNDVYTEKKGTMTNEEAVNFLNDYFMKEHNRKAAENLEAGEKFLKENAQKSGVVVDPEGYQYMVLVQGNGPKPVATDMVKVLYHGTRIDGEEFDSRLDPNAPAQFNLSGVIRGWTLGLQHMNVGSKYKFFFPPELAYGANPRPGGPIQPNDVLIFEVELLEIVTNK